MRVKLEKSILLTRQNLEEPGIEKLLKDIEETSLSEILKNMHITRVGKEDEFKWSRLFIGTSVLSVEARVEDSKGNAIPEDKLALEYILRLPNITNVIVFNSEENKKDLEENLPEVSKIFKLLELLFRRNIYKGLRENLELSESLLDEIKELGLDCEV